MRGHPRELDLLQSKTYLFYIVLTHDSAAHQYDSIHVGSRDPKRLRPGRNQDKICINLIYSTLLLRVSLVRSLLSIG